MTLQAKELEEEMDAAFIDVEYQLSVESCKDHDVSQHAVLSSHPSACAASMHSATVSTAAMA